MDDACSRSRARVESRNAASHTALHGRRSRRVPRRAVASTSATTVAAMHDDGAAALTFDSSLFLSRFRERKRRGERDRAGFAPPARGQRLCRYQIPRTALSCAFTPDDDVPSLRSCFLRRSIKFPGRNRIVFSTPCCVLHRTRPEALHYHIISSSLADYRRQERHVCAYTFAYPVPEVDSESVFP